MDAKFLKDIQQAGWIIESSTESEVMARCGNVNCQLRAKLAEGASIPTTCEGRSSRVFEQPIMDLRNWIDVLRDRRQQLCLTIRDVEAIIGAATDSVAKYESHASEKVPTVEFMMLWSQAVGLDFLSRPTKLSNYAVRTISETRAKVAARTKRFDLEARRRGKRQLDYVQSGILSDTLCTASETALSLFAASASRTATTAHSGAPTALHLVGV